MHCNGHIVKIVTTTILVEFIMPVERRYSCSGLGKCGWVFPSPLVEWMTSSPTSPDWIWTNLSQGRKDSFMKETPACSQTVSIRRLEWHCFLRSQFIPTVARMFIGSKICYPRWWLGENVEFYHGDWGRVDGRSSIPAVFSPKLKRTGMWLWLCRRWKAF